MPNAASPLLMPRSSALPEMYACRQHVFSDPLGDECTIQAVREAFGTQQWASKVGNDRTVAIACGSRGINRIDLVIRTLVALVREAGGKPFVFPAMGTHGGATVEGQIAVLETLGVTEQSIGCPIVSSMETVLLAKTPCGLPVFIDKQASGADAILVVNRIKPHTNFLGTVESGLMKMLSIGMGKADQAPVLHSLGVSGLRDRMPVVARVVLEKAPVAGCLALLEDGRHQLSRVTAIDPEAVEQEETQLLAEVRAWQPEIPIDDLDLLIIDEIGKEISGTGMDTKVVGRCRLLDFHAFDRPRIKVIAVLGLSEATHGNAIGIGMSDITTRRVAEAFEPISTYRNSVVSHSPAMAALPVTVETDKELVRTALDYLCNPKPVDQARIVRIQNTLELHNVEVSAPVADAIRDREDIELSSKPFTMDFDADDRLLPLRVDA
jgi:hypothetical protein